MSSLKIHDLDSQNFIIDVTDSESCNISGGGWWENVKSRARGTWNKIKGGAARLLDGFNDSTEP